MMRPGTAALLCLLLTSFGLVGGTPEASATSQPSIHIISVSNVSVKTGSCQHIPITVVFNPAGYTVGEIDTQIWLDNANIDSVYMTPAEGSSSVSDSYLYCPTDGLGRFQAGPSQITYYDGNFNEYTTDDQTAARFEVKQWSGTSMSVQRAGKRVTASARVRFFSVNTDSIVGADDAKVTLYRRRSSTAPWQPMGSVRTNRQGVASFSERSRRRMYWLAATSATSRSWGSMSKVRSS